MTRAENSDMGPAHRVIVTEDDGSDDEDEGDLEVQEARHLPDFDWVRSPAFASNSTISF